MVVLLRNKDNDHIYKWNGDTEFEQFENLTTGKSGTINREVASKKFVIPTKLNEIANENQNLVELIKILGLKIENQNGK